MPIPPCQPKIMPKRGYPLLGTMPHLAGMVARGVRRTQHGRDSHAPRTWKPRPRTAMPSVPVVFRTQTKAASCAFPASPGSTPQGWPRKGPCEPRLFEHLELVPPVQGPGGFIMPRISRIFFSIAYDLQPLGDPATRANKKAGQLRPTRPLDFCALGSRNYHDLCCGILRTLSLKIWRKTAQT